MSESPKVIVTGGAGFIGSHLARELAMREYRVTILDDLSTGKLENIEDLVKTGGVEFIEGSVNDLPLLQKSFKDVLYVFHLAALARVPRSIRDPLTTNEVNVNGTLKVLLAARDNGVVKVINSSSSSVYGNSAILPLKEEMTPTPMSPYAVSKLAAEHYCNVFLQIYGLSTISLRYFNVYGVNLDPDSPYATAVTAFLGRVSRNLPPIIFGDGKQTRDMTFVGDITKANVLAAGSTAHGIYNIGSGNRISINELAETIIRLKGKKLRPIYDKPRPGDPAHTLADISKAKQTFGYVPKWDIQAGLKETISHFPDNK